MPNSEILESHATNDILNHFTRHFRPLKYLTHLRLVSLLWDTGKQHSPRCDAAVRGVPSGAILFAWRNFIEKMRQNLKITPKTPNNESGLIQLITMGKSICHIWVNKHSGRGGSTSIPHMTENLLTAKRENMSVYCIHLIPHFYIAKQGYAGVYLFFLFLLQNIDCGYLLEPP